MKKWWPFGKNDSNKKDEALFLEQETELRQRFDDALANGHPRQQLLYQIEQESVKLEREAETAVNKAKLRAYDLLYSEIRPSMLANLTNGKNFEMAGQVDDAIRCYQAAIDDQVSTRFPYEHLRVIYRQRQQEDQALNVCQAALKNPYLSEKDRAHFQNWSEKIEAFLGASAA
ncbi:MAG: hypothetical protein AAF490_17100 [Chloroflexota bacterium]